MRRPAGIALKAYRDSEASGHAPRRRKARFGYVETTGRQLLRATRRKAAAGREPPHIGWAAGDRVDITIARLAVHGRGKQALGVRVGRRAEHRRDRTAFDDAARVHDGDRVGDLSSDP